MTFISENIIPGNHGKTFGTNAKKGNQIEALEYAISKIDGIKDVIVCEDVFPVEITIHTSKRVAVKDVQKAAISAGFHLIPETLFPL